MKRWLAFASFCFLVAQNVSIAASGGNAVWAIDHTRAELLEVRSQERLFLATLPEQGAFCLEKSSISAYELTTRSKAEAPHLVVVRAGIRQFYWTFSGEVLIIDVPKSRYNWKTHQLIQPCLAVGAKQDRDLYLKIRNLRI